MITEDLVNYIKKQNSKNVSRDTIVSRLVRAGWHIEDVEEGLIKAIPVLDPTLNLTPSISKENENEIKTDQKLKIEKSESELKTEKPKTKYHIDPYHEPIDLDLEPLAINIKQPKIIEEEKVEEAEKEEIKIEPKIEPKIEFKTEPDIKKEETLKIWTPSAIKPVEEIKDQLEDKTEEEKPIIKPVSTRTIESFQPELNKPKEAIKPVFTQPIIKEIKSETNEEKVIPTLTPKPKMKEEEKENSSWVMPSKTEIPDSKKSLSKIAMISSYSKDYLSANKLKQEVSRRRKSTLLKWLIVVLIISILGGTVFVFAEGYIKIPNINLPFIKKDPKIILLNNATNFALLKSYKVETEATISLPSFANITSGLMGGESIASNDKESFSYKAKGVVDKLNSTSLSFDYDFNINSSMLKNEIKTNIKYDGSNYFINIPDLNSLLGKSTPPSGIISIPANQQINQLEDLLPNIVQEKVNSFNLSNLKVSNISNLNNQITSSFRNLTGNIKMIKKGEQEIHGITTYQYSVSVDHSDTKQFFNDILENSFVSLSNDQKIKLKEVLGAISINSLEVWIGKKDNFVYQYKINISMPLSKVIGLEDKGIANNKVTFDWKITFYDLNVPNNISISLKATNLDDFIKNVKDISIKNIISSFTSSAQIMKNALGNYGKKSNLTGSCEEPVPGSLFSPLGHSKGASTIVGVIASTMNTIVNQTNGDSMCYSTPKAWAIASPLASDPNSYFCVDSKENSVILIEPLSGTSCQ